MKAFLLAILVAACAQTHHSHDTTVGTLLDGAATHEDPNAAALLEEGHPDPNAAALLTEPETERPSEVTLPPHNQTFCCSTAGDDGTGSNCVAISAELLNNCNSEGKHVLFCGGSYKFGDGKVTCID